MAHSRPTAKTPSLPAPLQPLSMSDKEQQAQLRAEVSPGAVSTASRRPPPPPISPPDWHLASRLPSRPDVALPDPVSAPQAPVSAPKLPQPVHVPVHQPAQAPAPRAASDEQPTSPIVQGWGTKWSLSNA